MLIQYLLSLIVAQEVEKKEMFDLIEEEFIILVEHLKEEVIYLRMLLIDLKELLVMNLRSDILLNRSCEKADTKGCAFA